MAETTRAAAQKPKPKAKPLPAGADGPIKVATTRPKTLPRRLLTALRRQLEEERLLLDAQIERLDAEFRDESWKEPRSDDDAETGSATFERERTMSLAQNARTLRTQIDKALARMDAGTFGRCAACGELIAAERIEALPQAVHCVDCQRKAERSGR